MANEITDTIEMSVTDARSRFLTEVLATIEVLGDPDLVEQIRRGEREIEAGEGMTIEELEAQVARDLEAMG